MADRSASQIAIRDCRIRIRRSGSGNPMLFLHGADMTAIAEEILPHFRNRLPQKTSVAAE